MNNSPLSIFFLIGAIAVFAYFLLGDGSISNFHSLKESLDTQRVKTEELRTKVDSLKSQAYKLKKDDRFLEQAARNELGLARPDELIFLFDD